MGTPAKFLSILPLRFSSCRTDCAVLPRRQRRREGDGVGAGFLDLPVDTLGRVGGKAVGGLEDAEDELALAECRPVTSTVRVACFAEGLGADAEDGPGAGAVAAGVAAAVAAAEAAGFSGGRGVSAAFGRQAGTAGAIIATVASSNSCRSLRGITGLSFTA